MSKSQEETICISSQEKENISQESVSAVGSQEDVITGIDHSQKSVISISSQESEAPLPTTPTQGIRLGLSKFAVMSKKHAVVTSSLLGFSSKQAPAGLGKARVSGLSQPPKKAPALHQISVLSMFARIPKKADLGPSQGSQD